MPSFKAAVEFFCSVLVANGVQGINAEVLRRAKLGREEVQPQLWKALHDLIVVCRCGGHLRCDISKAWAILADGGGISFPGVKRAVVLALSQEGYSRAFVLRESGGSRELCVAIAWMAAKHKIVERHLERVRARALSKLPVLWCPSQRERGERIVPMSKPRGGESTRHITTRLIMERDRLLNAQRRLQRAIQQGQALQKACGGGLPPSSWLRGKTFALKSLELLHEGELCASRFWEWVQTFAPEAEASDQVAVRGQAGAKEKNLSRELNLLREYERRIVEDLHYHIVRTPLRRQRQI